MNTQTNLTNQNYNDIKKIVFKNNLDFEESIKIAAQFGSALTKQNFDEPTEYYTFLEKFKKHRDLD
jgi:hypothetical protein